MEGATLIEALSAVFVLSIGLLGLAGMQANSLRFNHTAMMRSIAVQQAYNLADRMRANPNGVFASAYNNPAETEVADCFTLTGCTPAQMATTDFAVWMQANRSLLPGGGGSVCIDSNPNDGTGCDGISTVNPYSHVVTVSWSEYGEAKSFSFPVRISTE